jgi:hypothetical protein
MLMLFFTLDSVQLTQKRTKKFSLLKMKNFFCVETMKQLFHKSLEVLLSLKEWKYIDQLFFIPITMWTTIETAFLTAQFTRVTIHFIEKLKSCLFFLSGFYNMSHRDSVKRLLFLTLKSKLL